MRKWFPDTENPQEGPSAQFGLAPTRTRVTRTDSSALTGSSSNSGSSNSGTAAGKEDSEMQLVERRAYHYFGIRLGAPSPDADMYPRWLVWLSISHAHALEHILTNYTQPGPGPAAAAA